MTSVFRSTNRVLLCRATLVVLAAAAVCPGCGDDSGPSTGGDGSVTPPPDPPAPPPDADMAVPSADGGPNDAAPDPVDADRGPCPSPGTTRTVPCPRCGIASQTCEADGNWGDPTECMDQQECDPGMVEREDLFCGSRSRICDDSCHWRPWSEVSSGGECEAGTVERVTEGCPAGLTRERTCSTDCRWSLPTGACVGTCSGAPMPSRSGADPVCIPAGPFILGSEELPDAQPVREITLSEFWIDRTPVTRARFDQCLDEGVCIPLHPVDQELYDMLGPNDLAVYVNWSAAIFCEWDGGRLPSEFQWEKAARGPAPDERRHAWGDEDGGCEQHPWDGCRSSVIPADAFPLNVSPFGVRLLGIRREPTRTGEDTNYSDIPDIDPEGFAPASEGDRVFRGYGWLPSATRPPPPTACNRGSLADVALRCVY